MAGLPERIVMKKRIGCDEKRLVRLYGSAGPHSYYRWLKVAGNRSMRRAWKQALHVDPDAHITFGCERIM